MDSPAYGRTADKESLPVASGVVGKESVMAPRTFGRGVTVGLVLLAACEAAALVWFLSHDPVASNRIYAMAHANAAGRPGPDYAAIRKHDPPLASALPACAASAQLRKIAAPGRAGYLVDYVGGCAGCLDQNPRSWPAEARAFNVQVVLLGQATPAVASRFARDLGIHAPVACEPDGRLSGALNAAWTGRAYLFSSSWKLFWIQPAWAPGYDPFHAAAVIAILKGLRNET